MRDGSLSFPVTVQYQVMYSRRLAEALPEVQERIGDAAARSGREGDRVRVVAITKGHPLEAVHAALAAGLEDLGENRLDELERKRMTLEEAADPGPRPRWHMVGHVQSRKGPRVRDLADVLHSLDSLKLARRLERTAPGGEAPLPVLVQVNTSGEESKYGFSPSAFRDGVEELLELESLSVLGLMTMAPLTEDRELLRTTFRRLTELQEEARARHSTYTGEELSMGMSNDYELAIEEGSTFVRLGTVLFGERPE